MAHEHPIRDVDKRFVIDINTRIVTIPNNVKPVLTQYDHNSEFITFEIERYIEGHDLLKCDKVEIHYNNISSSGKQTSRGVYEVEDFCVDSTDSSKVTFTWIISEMATKYAGTLHFIVAFSCTDEGDLDYRWNTLINSELTVQNGINNGQAVVESYADVLEMWKQDLFGIGDTEEAQMLAVSKEQQEAIIAKGNDIVSISEGQIKAMEGEVDRIKASLPSDYTALNGKVDDLYSSLDAVALKLPLECTTHTGDSTSTVISVSGDGFNNLLEWNTTGTNYIYVAGQIGKWGDFDGKILHVALRNESENDIALDNLQVILSGAKHWGNIYKSTFLSVGPLASGDTVIVEIDASTLKINPDGSGKTFESDSPVFLLIADQSTGNGKNTNNNNRVRFFCVADDRDKMFNTVGYTVYSHRSKDAYHSSISDHATESDVARMSNFANEAGYHVFEEPLFYANEPGKRHCNATYDIGTYTTTFEFTQLVDEEPNDVDGAGNPRLWTYTINAFDITNLFGKGARIVAEFTSDSDDPKVLETVYMCYYIGAYHASWSNTYTDRTSIYGSSAILDLDLDNMKWKNEPDLSKPVYLGFGYDYHSRPNEYGLCSTPPACNITIRLYYTIDSERIVATELAGFNPQDHYTKSEIDKFLAPETPYITCWGDSLTAGGGWTTRLQELTGMTVYNGGTGGENVPTIVARQGADAIVLNNITIPAGTSAITLATRADDTGLTTIEGNKVTPLFQGGAHVNPCKIGDVLGTLKWTGSSYQDTTGVWTFARQTAGDAVTINRPTILRTDFDMNKNKPHLMVIFMGQNGGYNNDVNELIRWHRLMIEHAQAKHVIVLGLSSGSANSRADYEASMKKEFGRYFISLREYLSTPIYDDSGKIINCYGLDDQGLTATANDLTAIASGTVPASCLTDSVHYTSGTKTVIGELIYKRCCELNIF